jgi:hypothetical protein
VSKARLVITAVVVEGRQIREVSGAYGVARFWIYELLARNRAEVRQRSSRSPAGRTATRLRSRPRQRACVQAFSPSTLPNKRKSLINKRRSDLGLHVIRDAVAL